MPPHRRKTKQAAIVPPIEQTVVTKMMTHSRMVRCQDSVAIAMAAHFVVRCATAGMFRRRVLTVIG